MKKALSILVAFALVVTMANMFPSVFAASPKKPQIQVCPPWNRAEIDNQIRLYGAPADDRAMTAPYDKANTFTLHSKAGSNHTIYLDFNGHTVTNTLWNTYYANGNPIVVPAFSFEGGADFSDKEHSFIQQVWQEVSDDYSIFDVDVTTEEPPIAKLEKSGASDMQFGMRVCIGGSASDWYNMYSATGVAYMDVFGEDPTFYGSQHTTTPPAMVFGGDITNYIPDIFFKNRINTTANTVSHEVGHTLGLLHDGFWENIEGHGKVIFPYYGSSHWTPIMGSSGAHIQQWNNGTYRNAVTVAQDEIGNNIDAGYKQDDIAVISDTLGFNADDAGNAAADAVNIPLSNDKGVAEGVIGQNSDKDFYKFTLTQRAIVTIDVNSGNGLNGGNLDVLAKLYDSSSSLIEQSDIKYADVNCSFSIGNSDHESSHKILTAKLENVPLDAGTYYISVEGTGAEFPLSSGALQDYPAYGSVGKYSIDIGLSDKFVSGVTVSSPTMQLNTISEITGKITASVTPADAVNKKVTWTSSNETVATVSADGTVTPLTVGDTVITATTVDGGFTAETNVNVRQATDQECVDFVHSKLSGYTGMLEISPKILGDNLSLGQIKRNLNLYTAEKYGVTIQWSTYQYYGGDPFIDVDGTVHRPALGWKRNAGSVQNPIWVEHADVDVYYIFKKGAVTSTQSGIGVTVIPQYYIGDADGDETVDITDALVALKSVVGAVKFDSDGIASVRADVDGDGAVTALDALHILRKSAEYRVGELD